MTDPTLDLMLEDLADQDSLHQPTSFWQEASLTISKEFRSHGVDKFRSLRGPLAFFVPTYGPPGSSLGAELVEEIWATVGDRVSPGSKQEQTLRQLLEGEQHALGDFRTYLAADQPEQPPILSHCSESDAGEPLEQFTFDGRQFSRSMLNYMLALVFLKKHVDTTNISTVLEVGGGFGSLGEILASDPKNRYTYVDVDIPPTAAAASYYLKRIFGERLLEYSESRGRCPIVLNGGFDAAVLCPWQLPNLQGSFDLFVNAISFQEMEPAVVRFYLDHVDRLGTRLVLLRNLREGKQKKGIASAIGVEEPVLGEDYDSFLPNYDLIAENTVPFGYRTVDGFHSELRLYERRSA